MAKNLEQAIKEAGSPVKLLWNSTSPPAIVPRVIPEFTNWRDEQLAWRRTAVLYDQSHHMANLNIKGPDALKPGQRAITSFNRNWTNRMGLGGEGFLASPSVVAASAMLGYMAPPSELGLEWQAEAFAV